MRNNTPAEPTHTDAHTDADARVDRWMVAVVAIGVLIGTAMASSKAQAAIIGDTMGDTTYESVYGKGGEQTLSSMFSEYTHASTGQPLITGDVNAGEDPTQSHQSQFQRFHVTEDATLSLTLMGGYAGYKNIFGVYTYDESEDPLSAELTTTSLLTHKVDSVGTTIEFNVSAGQYFGFYIDANGHTNSQGVYYSENARNSDGDAAGVETDHFLMFESNAGLLITMEDLAYKNSGKLGDQDYQDMVVGLLTFSDGTPIPFDGGGGGEGNGIPEPATLVLCALGTMVVVGRRRRVARS